MNKSPGGLGILGGFLLFVGLFGCLVLLWLFVFRTGPSLRPKPTNTAADRMREFKEAPKSAAGTAERLVAVQEKRVQASGYLVGQDRRVGEVFEAEFASLFEKAKARDNAFQAFAEAGFAMPLFDSPTAIAERKKLATAWLESDELLVEAYRTLELRLSDRLMQSLANQEIATSNVTAFLTAARAQDAVRLWELDAQSAVALSEMLDLYASEWGKWSADSSGFVDFTDDTVEAKFNKLRERVEVLTLQRDALMEELSKPLNLALSRAGALMRLPHV